MVKQTVDELLTRPIQLLFDELLDRTNLLETYSATKKTAETFKRLLAKSVSDVERREIATTHAKALMKKPVATSVEAMTTALAQYPEEVIPFITALLLIETKWTLRTADIYATGNTILYHFETILKWCDAKLWVMDQTDIEVIRFQENRGTVVDVIMKAIEEIRRTEGFMYTDFMEYFDQYERFQISTLEGEGGICR